MPSIGEFRLGTEKKLPEKGAKEDFEAAQKISEGQQTISKEEEDRRIRLFSWNQVILAQFFKLVVLFVIALVHVFYARDFIFVFRSLEEFLESSLHRAAKKEHVLMAEFLLNLLVDYKKNLYITVGAMCACLSASCFFLILMRDGVYRPIYVMIMRVVDFAVFMSLPFLLLARLLLVKALLSHGEDGLTQASKTSSPETMMVQLHCSVIPREQVPLCFSVLERSIFPVVVVEYLVVLCIITTLYVGLAYAIVYCIKHWFPHTIFLRYNRSQVVRPTVSPKVTPSRTASSSQRYSRPPANMYVPLRAEQLA